MINEEDDFSDCPPEFRDEAPAPAGKKPTNELAKSNVGPREEPRGIGPVAYKRQPIGCVVEILKRGWSQEINGGKGGWILYPPFDRGTPKDAKWSFAIMTPTTTTTRMIGTRESSCRSPHPDFAAFNTCDPEKAQSIGMKVVHFNPKDAWNFHLGAYKAPQGKTGPQKGWWCKGDGCTAVRNENGKESVIKCPNRMCEYSQKGTGAGGNGTHCKCHTCLIGNFNWSENSPLPRIMFEWNSQSYHAYQNVEAVFDLVKTTAANLNIPDLPVFGLPIRLSVKKSIKPGKSFPEVHASFDGDMMKWIAMIRGAMQSGQIGIANQLEAPLPLNQLPPPGMTQTDIDEVNMSRLNPHYRPSNERK